MKKRNVRIIALMLAAVIAAGSPMPVRAADFEIEEEVILGGTGGESTALYEKESEETLFQGTVEVSENEIADQDMQASLDKAANYLKTHVTNPVVNTLGGEWSVLAMARYGNLPEETKKNYLANLYRTLEENQGVLDKRKYTEYSRVVLALTAIGVDPSDVNGYNMLYPLANFKQVNWQGVNGTIYALLALDSKNYEIPKLTEEDLGKGLEQTTREKLIQQILDKQLSDGGWALSGTKSDPDMTAMAIQALAPYYEKNSGVETAVEKALQTLSTMQDENGGFASFGTENLESAAQTVIALSTLNVELLSDEAFIKNGKSVLDYLLSYQLSDGAFKHTPQENAADAMSTDQGAMALVAYNRAVNGKNTLYDMTDVQNGGDEEEETAENIARFRAKLEVLPAQIRIKDQQTVYALISELDQMKKFAEKEEFRGRLQEKLEEISEQIKVVESLDEQIWNEINPLAVTLKDAEKIAELLKIYESIPKENLEYVEHRADLLQADTIVKKLQNGILAKEIFTNVKDSSIDYVYETWNYTLTLRGANNYEPADMKAGVTSEKKDGKYFFTTEESGTLPGNIDKAYSSAVGAGAFVSEIFGDEADELRRRGGDGGEFGATTGRPRRMGWFDAVASKYGCRMQGTTDVAFTVLDVLGYLDEIPVCVGYDIDGEVTTDFPTTTLLEKAKPVYETLPGWKCDIRGIKKYEDLPENCRKYIEFVEEKIGFPITMISNGPGRDDIIYR